MPSTVPVALPRHTALILGGEGWLPLPPSAPSHCLIRWLPGSMWSRRPAQTLVVAKLRAAGQLWEAGAGGRRAEGPLAWETGHGARELFLTNTSP